MIMADESLKPCPFCGSDAMVEESIRYPFDLDTPYHSFSVLCSNENCIACQREKFYKLEQSARIAWNRRVVNKESMSNSMQDN